MMVLFSLIIVIVIIGACVKSVKKAEEREAAAQEERMELRLREQENEDVVRRWKSSPLLDEIVRWSIARIDDRISAAKGSSIDSDSTAKTIIYVECGINGVSINGDSFVFRNYGYLQLNETEVRGLRRVLLERLRNHYGMSPVVRSEGKSITIDITGFHPRRQMKTF